jgi:uncharacterized protein involved in response to NO
MPTLFATAFRPFFILAGAAAALLLPIWLAALSGHGPAFAHLGWHAHELIYGFAAAVLAGFFLTAVPKWTGRPRHVGGALIGLVLIWLSGRVIQLVPDLAPSALGALDSLFLFALAAAIGVPIFRTASTRNLLFPVLVAGLAAADVVGHVWPEWATHANRGAVFAVVGIIVIFGGRITPMFTRNALRGVAEVRARTRLDDAAITSVILAGPLAVLPPDTIPHQGTLIAVVGGTAAALNLLRMRGWATRHTGAKPLLWILHVGYAWVPVALGCWALSAARPDLLRPSTALHAATAGVLGTYTLGMMSRVSLGHTARPLVAPKALAIGFVAITLAALLRVVGPLLTTSPAVLHAAGGLWTLAFALYTVVYTPWLLKPRLDGKPG